MSDPEGWKIALERIAVEAEIKRGFLDLGQLELTEFPEALFELSHLRSLNLGVGRFDENGIWRLEFTVKASHNDLSVRLRELVRIPSLRNLYLSGFPVDDLTNLAGLQKLQSLDCSDTQVGDLAPLARLQNLQSLDCSFTQVGDLAPLARLQNLQSLNCSDTQVGDLAPLARLQNLQSLDCSSTQVGDLAPLAGLQNLHSLDCSDTQVGDLAPLARLQNLQSLNCSSTQVGDLAPLARLQNLQSLYCSFTQVSDLAPLAQHMGLKSLGASGCKLNCSLDQLSRQLALNNSLETDTSVELILFDARVADAPPEVLSDGPRDDCLESLRAHYDELAVGSAPATDVKLMVLGNGRIGKTQICRKLRGEDYYARIASTHGVTVTSANCPGTDDVKLHLWDFGGQDIYHGAHALFMRSNAIFMIVWSPASEDQREHEYDGVKFRNFPLAYWVEYVRHLGGKDASVLIVQTRCDRPEDKARCPLSGDALWEAFGPNCHALHYSALTDLNRGALNDALAQAVTALHNRQGVARIGLGRHRVKLRLKKMRELDAKSPADQRQYRCLTQEQFKRICEEEDGPKEPKYLLKYLHNVGVVFHLPELFEDRIILDQQWALEAIYAVFNREKCYRQLLQLGGRFSRSLLDALVWRERGYDEQEQKLFLSMMQSCGVCFALREGDEKLGVETIYIAPDLLPEKASVQDAVDAQWDMDAPFEPASFEYDLLHQGLIRAIITRIGAEAGVSGAYWKGGLCVYEKRTRGHALIEQRMLDDMAGKISIATQGRQAAELLKQLIELVAKEQEKLGLTPKVAPQIAKHSPRVEGEVAREKAEKKLAVEFGKAPMTKSSLYVSYAWDDPTPDGKKREAVVDQLCASAEKRGTPIRRDKSVLTFGDSISNFMKEIGEGDRIFVILSDKYLKSPFCMFELFEIWRNSRQDEAAFLKRCRVYTLDAKIWSIKDRVAYADYWQAEYEPLIPKAALLGPKSHASFRLMKDFVNHVEEVLSYFADIVQPRKFEDLEKYGFDDPPEEEDAPTDEG
ncbi:MAG: leucine-rich repeat domain-containing protein [Methylocystis silviterrae]|uniref:leucine-rich repeat domain-containing protein n=1 Tax=Methylocystis silviterrae TaxID=2743612 RepID=UPI003C71B059